MPKKILNYTALVIVCFAIIFLLLFSPTIFQEGNPLPVVYGLITLDTTETPFVKINQNKYIFRANNGDFEKLTEYLRKNNLLVVDREGAGLLFKDKNGQNHTASIRMYTSQFEILDFVSKVKN
jgi:hypothetical protein